jgi:ketosteroid isomerase-like protein
MLALVAAAAAIPSSPDHDRSVLMASERAWGQAFVTGDVATVQRLLARDFEGFDVDGSAYDKADCIAFVRATPHGRADTVDQFRIRFFGDTAVVQAHEHVMGPPPETHSKERVFTDVWVKHGGDWKIVAAHDTLVQPKKK